MIVVLLSTLLLVFIAVSAALYYKANRQEKSLNDQSSQTEAIIEPLKRYDPASPINKLVDQNTGFTEYRVRGKITSQPELTSGITSNR